MHRVLLVMLACIQPLAAAAETVVAARTIRAHAVLGTDDLALAPGTIPGALTEIAAAVGREARTMIYAGRPLRAEDLAAPALVERNQIVTLRFVRGPLRITAEGRAMGRAAVGETVRAVNLSSRLNVIGTVAPDGSVSVSGSLPDRE